MSREEAVELLGDTFCMRDDGYVDVWVKIWDYDDKRIKIRKGDGIVLMVPYDFAEKALVLGELP